MGLFGRQTSLRGKVTKAQEKKINKYMDVLKGKASAIKTDRKTAKAFKEQYRTEGDVVVVPRKRGEKISYSAKSKKIIKKRKDYGQKITQEISPLSRTREQLISLGEKRGQYFVIELARGGDFETYVFPSFEEMQNFFERDTEMRGEMKNGGWMKFVQIMTAEDLEGEENVKRMRRRKGSKKSKAKTKARRRKRK